MVEDPGLSQRQCNDSSRQGLAGVISKIRLENFMCHSNSEVEFGDHINFITGQNGSGKSAILTALCVAFGCRAKGTQRASSLKDFIKTGCSHASIYVEIKNQGVDAFKTDIYGNVIVIERRISEVTSSTILKDHQGRKVGTRKDDILEIINHFNIDVENPCVVMSQDKSREFLSSGNDKDKFKFFFQATLLQKVNDLLLGITEHLQSANELILQLEESIRPTLKELSVLEAKIRSLESVEEISQKVQLVKKELAWSWVYDVDKKLEEQKARIDKLSDRIPTCQSKIDDQINKLDELREKLAEKRTQISEMVDKTTDVRIKKDELENKFTLATKEKLQLEGEHKRQVTIVERMANKSTLLEEQIRDIEYQSFKNTQFEENEMMEKIKHFQDLVDAANDMLARSKECERSISDMLSTKVNETQNIRNEIEEKEKAYHNICSSMHEIQKNQTNKVTAFGGDRVISLLRAIERHHVQFRKAPIGPIGVHVTLVNGDTWACAVENAVGKLLNAFIVTDHKDSLILRRISREANYSHLQIIIYDFSRPKLNIPNHMLPQTSHPTTFSVLSSDNPTVMNVLIDMGNAERQVLVQDYSVGRNIAFGQRVSNLKEVYTSDGYRMFSRGSVETILPPNKRVRTGRLCKSFGDRIRVLEADASNLKEHVEHLRSRKRIADEELQVIRSKLHDEKRKCINFERDVMSKKLAMEDVKKSYDAVTSAAAPSEVDDLRLEISNIKEEIKVKEASLSKIELRIVETEEKARDLKLSLENLCEFAKGGLESFEEAESELMQIEENIRTADMERIHYENVMKKKVLVDVMEAKEKYEEMQLCRKESYEKASIICPEKEVENHIGGSPEKLSGHLNKLQQKLRNESEKYSESLDDLRMTHEKKQRKILRKQQIYKDFRDKLTACERALDCRWRKFKRNATLLKRHLTWQFNGHLKKKGISGVVQVNFQNKTLSIEVKMPQDSSSDVVRDTRGLSGGERSFSTLCFALALHEMTEGPFRAMDEFDVFMDAVSRKISLDTLIDFALEKGSQWIFITPHDISMARDHERIKKQQLAAPRS